MCKCILTWRIYRQAYIHTYMCSQSVVDFHEKPLAMRGSFCRRTCYDDRNISRTEIQSIRKTVQRKREMSPVVGSFTQSKTDVL